MAGKAFKLYSDENLCMLPVCLFPFCAVSSFYERKYKVFLRLFTHQREYQDLMNPR